MTQQSIIHSLSSASTKQLLQKCYIKHLWLFGSTAQGENTEKSDIDLLYELDSSQKIDGFVFFSAISHIKELIKKEVDMVSIDFIHPDIKEEVLHNRIQLW